MRKKNKKQNKGNFSLETTPRNALMIEQADFFKIYIQRLKLLAEQSLQEIKETSSNEAISYPWQQLHISNVCSICTKNYVNKRVNTTKFKLISEFHVILQDISTREMFFKLEDKIQTSLLQNEFTVKLSLQISGNSILNALLMLSTIPFVKGAALVTLSFQGQIFDKDLIENDVVLKQSIFESIRLSTEMIFSRTTLQFFEGIPFDGLSAEAIAKGIIDSEHQHNSHCLDKFQGASMFKFISTKTAALLIGKLSTFSRLTQIDLGQIDLVSLEEVQQLNKLLDIVSYAKLGIGDIGQNRMIKFLKFREKYSQLDLTFSCDELAYPEAYQELFSCIAQIQNIFYLKLINSFNLDSVTPTRDTSKKFQSQHVSQYKFFEQLIAIKLVSMEYTGMISRNTFAQIMNLSKYGNVSQIQINQSQLKLTNPFSMPPSLRKIYESEADIDLSDVYELFHLKKQQNFSVFYKQGSIQIVQHKMLTLELACIDENQIFKPLQFSSDSLERLTVSITKITKISQLEELFKQTSQCKALRFVNIDVTFDAILRRKVQYNCIKQQNSQIEQSLVQQQPIYATHLNSLMNLIHVILSLDLNQEIIDSLSSLFSTSNSIKIFILRKKLLSQYTLNFSVLISALRQSNHLTHSLLDCKLESVQISIQENKKIYDDLKIQTFYKPLAELFADPMCKLNILEIVEENAIVSGIEMILAEIIKKNNKTLLNLHCKAIPYGSQINQGQDSLYEQAISKNLFKLTSDCEDSLKFTSVF